MPDIAIIKLRYQIMKERGMVPPASRKIDVTNLPIPDPTFFEEIPLLPKMKYIEVKYDVKVKLDVFIGSINDVCSRYNWEIDRSTVSRWRKYLKRFLVEVPKK